MSSESLTDVETCFLELGGEFCCDCDCASGGINPLPTVTRDCNVTQKP